MAEHDAPGPDEPRQGAGEDSTRESTWDDVATQFSSLGKQLRRRFEQPGAAAGEASSESQEESSAAGREGARRWIDALDDTFTKLGDTVRDPEFRKEAGTSVSRLGEALGASLRDLGEQLQRKFGARHDPPGSAGERMPDVPPPPASAPPASAPPASGAPADAPPAGGPAGGPPPAPPAGGTPPPAGPAGDPAGGPAGDPPPAPPAGGTPPPAPPADRPQDPPPAP